MKKRVFSVLICAALMTSLCACGNKEESAPSVSAPQAGDDRVNPIEKPKPEWEYREMDDGTISISVYNGKDAVVTIPSEIDGKTVTRLGYFFSIDNEVTTKLVIPASVEDMPSHGLGKNLTEIVVEEGSESFYTKDGLVFSKGHFFDMLFMCPQGKTGEITVPDGTESIGSFAFGDCSRITAVKIPESAAWIGACAFRNCTALTSVNIPEAVTMISTGTFEGCTSLETLDIPETVTDIEASVFVETPFLENLKKQDPFVVINGILVDGTTLKGEVTIPDNVKKISGSAFSAGMDENTEIKKVILPESTTEIDSWAFENCTALEEVVLPGSVDRIKSYTFSGCTALKGIDLPDGLTYIGMYAFDGCKSLTSVDIPDGVTEIDMQAFNDCENLERVSVPDSVIYAGALNDCFDGCEKVNVTFKGKTYTAANMEEFYKAVEDNREEKKQ